METVGVIILFAVLVAAFLWYRFIEPKVEKRKAQRLARLTREFDNSSEPMQKMVTLIIYEAIKRNASTILFGLPSDDSTPKEPLAVSEPNVGSDTQEVDAMLANLEKEMEGLPSPPNIFGEDLTKNGKHAPLWFHINEKWIEAEGPPSRLLHQIINELEIALSQSNPGMPPPPWRTEFHMEKSVSFSAELAVSVTDHGCYMIKIKNPKENRFEQ